MSRFDSKKEEPSINELRGEVNSLKKEMRDIKSRLHYLEINDLAIKVSEKASLEKDNQGESSQNQDSDEEDSAGVTMITKVRPQSSHIMIKLVINNNLVLNKIALLDSGADEGFDTIMSGIKYNNKSMYLTGTRTRILTKLKDFFIHILGQA